MKDQKIKIYVTCFNNKILVPDNELFELVQGGAANAPIRFSGMSHDDEGDNISRLNARFNDMATIYWVWKNCDNDYYGFMQYRRFLSFDTEMLKEKQYEYPIETNDEKAFKRMKLQDPVYMRNFIEQYDVITCNYLQYPSEYSLYQQYYEVPYSFEKDIDLLIEIIQAKYPEYMSAVHKSLFEDGKGYFANLFIMRKKLFQKYCDWAFDILFEFDRRMDYTDYSFAERRAPGYISERLLGIFYTHLEMTTDCKFGMLQKCFFQTTREQPLDPPDFDAQKTVPVVFASNEYFLPYCGVTIQSILDHASSEYFYDFVILHEKLTPHAMKRFREACKGKHCSVRFVNVSSYFAGKALYQKGHFSTESYYRFALCDIMEKYEKVIYLDSDVIVRKDISDLMKVDLSGYALAAVQDADTAGLYNGYRPSRKKFAKRELKFTDPYDYFQAGVLVFNVNEFKKLASRGNLLELAKREWDLVDQDILNYVAHGHVKYLDMAWNVMNDWAGVRRKEIIGIAPEFLRKQYEQARKNPFIVHYAGSQKPWNDPNTDMAEFFYSVEKRSPLYRDIQIRHFLERFAKHFSDYQKETPESKDKGCSPKTWQCTLENNAFPAMELFPAFPENNIAIGMLSSSEFLPFAAVAIQSIIEHSVPDKNYDFLLFTDGIPKKRKDKILRTVEDYKNVSIRFINVSEHLKLLTGAVGSQYAKLLYIRVLWAHVLVHYNQIICVDSDMIVVSDIGIFENFDFGENYISAAHEWTYGEYGSELGLKNPVKEPMNAGFSVHNLKKIRDEYSPTVLLALCNAKSWRYCDQDVLNILFEGYIQYLDYDWNYRADLDTIGKLHKLQSWHSTNYKVRSPKIIHYAGYFKPWSLPNVSLEDAFWEVAERSTFYREILVIKVSSVAGQTAQAAVATQTYCPQQLPNLIRPDHPARKFLDVLLPKGSKRREFVKSIVRLFK